MPLSAPLASRANIPFYNGFIFVMGFNAVVLKHSSIGLEAFGQSATRSRLPRPRKDTRADLTASA
jgi:hypothetical protein